MSKLEMESCYSSYVPQVNNIFPNMTINENLEMGASNWIKYPSITANIINHSFFVMGDLVLFVRKEALIGEMKHYFYHADVASFGFEILNVQIILQD